MDFRIAFPAALLLGGILGVSAANLKTSPLAIVTELGAPTGAEMEVEMLGSAEPAVTWDIPVVRNESVQRFVNLFGEKQTDRMAIYLKRSGRYEGMIRAKLREQGMPEDLLYLSMIESGFNPTARSPAQAVGLWQFIAETGRRYGLRIDSYVDERRHPEKSTDAALRYLQDLHGRFGSWYLAAAAYNTGEGRVGRIMREVTGAERGREDDFWRIRHRLPRETRDYVPLIVAAALVGKEPHKYGLEGVERYLPVPTEVVAVPGGVDLGTVAKAVGVNEREIQSLNPHLLRGLTPPGKDYGVKIPAGRSALFAASFDRARVEARSQAELRRAEQGRVARATPKKAPARTASAARRSHKVRKGESLSVIARRHGTSVAALQRANGMGKRTALRAGQSLRIPR